MLAELEDHASRLRNHIQKIRIDFPEAATARMAELHEVYRSIAKLKAALALTAGSKP